MNPAAQSLAETRRLISADVLRRCTYENRPPNRWTRLRYLLNPGVATIALARWQRFFDDHGLGVFGGLCRWLNVVLYTSHIDSRAEVGPGLVVVHAHSIWIGPGTVLGPDCILFSQNAIGKSPFLEGAQAQAAGAPVIGAGVIFGVGACAHGAIHVGDGCRIAVNSLVEQDAAAGSTLYGVPARVVA